MQYDTIDEGASILSLLLKGPPGSGKTFKAAQFPSPVIFNFDNNTAGLRKLPEEVRKDIKLVNPRYRDGKRIPDVRVWDNFIKVLAEVVEDPSVRTVVIDSMTTLSSIILDKAVGASGPEAKVQIQHYGEFSRYFKWLGDEVLCSQGRDKIFIFIAHEQEAKDGTLTLNVPTSIRDSFDLYFSDCWRTFTKVPISGSIQYLVRVMPGANYRAKCSLELPTEFEWEKEKDNIMKQIKESLPS